MHGAGMGMVVFIRYRKLASIENSDDLGSLLATVVPSLKASKLLKLQGQVPCKALFGLL